jgi:hypothetical protein
MTWQDELEALLRRVARDCDKIADDLELAAQTAVPTRLVRVDRRVRGFA